MIRPMRADDAAAIAAIYNVYVRETDISFETEPLTAEEMGRRLAGIAARYPCLVYEEEGAVRGYCYAHAWKERAAYAHTWETTVYVAREHTGRGIGRRLMERLVAACAAAGCEVLIACITGGNAASEGLHRALGFSRVSCFRRVGRKHGRWLDVVDYERVIGGASGCGDGGDAARPNEETDMPARHTPGRQNIPN